MGLRVITVVMLIILSGCTHYYQADPCGERCATEDPSASKAQSIKLTETGHGAVSQLNKFSHAQKELLAMRASKLDAYRALSERLYGTSILGSSKVEELVLANDHLSIITESLLRGARIVSTRRLAVGGYESIVELVISPRLQLCLTNPKYFYKNCSPGSTRRASLSSPGRVSNNFYFVD